MKQASLSAYLGNLLRPKTVAGLMLLSVAMSGTSAFIEPAWAQLPPVNMGKFIHQPGDNQYSAPTQNERHGPVGGGYQIVNPQPQQVQGPSGWTRTPHKGGDISLEPIVCDEPIPVAGFPPVPDGLDLPGVRGGGSFTNYSSGGGGGGGGYGGGGGGAMAPGAPMPPPENHQGYTNYAPGYFAKGKTTGKGAEMYSSGDGGGGKNSGGGGGGGPSDSQRALGRMGKEPSLDKNASAQVQAPEAMQINQASTQDLSLPDDDSSNTGKRSTNQINRAASRFKSRAGNMMMQPLYQMPIRMPSFGH